MLAGVPEADSGVAASLLSTGQQLGGSIGLAVLGTVAWTVVSGSVRAQAAAAGAASSSAALSSGALRAAAYSRALAAGFDRAFLVAAGISVLLLVTAVTMIRIRRADLAGH